TRSRGCRRSPRAAPAGPSRPSDAGAAAQRSAHSLQPIALSAGQASAVRRLHLLMSDPSERLSPHSIWPEDLLGSAEKERPARRRRLKRRRSEAERLCEEAAELVRKRNGPL